LIFIKNKYPAGDTASGLGYLIFSQAKKSWNWFCNLFPTFLSASLTVLTEAEHLSPQERVSMRAGDPGVTGALAAAHAERVKRYCRVYSFHNTTVLPIEE
jgi:hypothetical protein